MIDLPEEMWEIIWEFEGNSYYKKIFSKSLRAITCMGGHAELRMHSFARSLPFLEFMGKLYSIAFFNNKRLPSTVRYLDKEAHTVYNLIYFRRFF